MVHHSIVFILSVVVPTDQTGCCITCILAPFCGQIILTEDVSLRGIHLKYAASISFLSLATITKFQWNVGHIIASDLSR